MAKASTRVVIAALIGNAALAAAKYVAAAVQRLGGDVRRGGALDGRHRQRGAAAARHPARRAARRRAAPVRPRQGDLLLGLRGGDPALRPRGRRLDLQGASTSSRRRSRCSTRAGSTSCSPSRCSSRLGSLDRGLAAARRRRGAGRPLLAGAAAGEGSGALPADLRRHRGASPASLVALVGVFCADRLGWLWADGAATLAIGGILALAAVLLADRDPRPSDRRGGRAAPRRGHHRRGGAGRLRPRGERGAHHAVRARRTSW